MLPKGCAAEAPDSLLDRSSPSRGHLRSGRPRAVPCERRSPESPVATVAPPRSRFRLGPTASPDESSRRRPRRERSGGPNPGVLLLARNLPCRRPKPPGDNSWRHRGRDQPLRCSMTPRGPGQPKPGQTPSTRDSGRALIDGGVGFRTRGGSRAAGPRDSARSPPRASACACAGSATPRAVRRPRYGPRSRRCPAR